MSFLTIITPTYNRAKYLSECFLSLKKQTDLDFQWIIVDDGSSDDTRNVVESFRANSLPFEIHYIYKENGGKHTALNAALNVIKGKYVLILDSDDKLIDNAIAIIRKRWKFHENDTNIGIVTFLKGRSVDEPVCVALKENVPVDIMRNNRKEIYGSDCCEVIRSELYRKYPFPVFENEKFLSECALWSRVSMTHKCVYYNEVIYLFEYLEGGLTKSGRILRIKNPNGGMYTAKLKMVKKNDLKQRIKNSLLYICYGFFSGKNIRSLVNNSNNKGLAFISLFPGYALYRFWKRKYV